MTTAKVPGPLSPGIASGVNAMSYLCPPPCVMRLGVRMRAREQHLETEERDDQAAGDAHARDRDAEEIHDQAARDEEARHQEERVGAGAADLAQPLLLRTGAHAADMTSGTAPNGLTIGRIASNAPAR